MALTPLRLVLFLLGLLVAATGVGYVGGVFETPTFKQFAARLTGAEVPVETAVKSTDTDAITTKSDIADKEDTLLQDGALPGIELAEPAKDASEVELSKESSESAVIAPAFHMLRVEPDGSVVVVGEAEPKSSVEIVSGSSVLAETKVDPSGDFVAVLDQALKPGDYSIVLRSTSVNNVVATSPQTAIVSVPSTTSGQVVALVQEPGQPSRLITVPEVKANVTEASQQPVEPVRSETETQTLAEATAENAATAEAPAADASSETEVVKADVKQPETDVKSEAVIEPTITEAASSETISTGVEAPQTADKAGSESASPEDAAKVAKLDEQKPVTIAPASEAEAVITKAEAPKVMETVQGAESTSKPETEVEEAVKVTEDTSVTEEKSVKEDQSLVEAKPAAEPAPKAVAVAPFIEAVEIDGREVFIAGRAEAGRKVRVYVNDLLLGQAVVEPDGNFLIHTQRDLPTGDYIVRLDVLGTDGDTVIARAAVPFEREAGETMTVVADKSEPKPEELPQSDLADVAPLAPQMHADQKVAAVTQTETQTTKSSVIETKITTDPVQPTNENATVTEKSAVEQAEQVVVKVPENSTADSVSNGESVHTAPALKRADGAVIIRKGDTLWQISRRVYGRGMRYTTIYVANKDQIRDPDMIWPGQIFSLPEHSLEGEAANLSTVETINHQSDK